MAHKGKLLVVGPLPPPWSGPEIVTRNIMRCQTLKDSYDVCCLNTTVRQSNDFKGKLDSAMVFAFIKYSMRLAYLLVTMRPDCVFYLPTSATLKGWVRDGLTMLIARPSGATLIILFQGGHFRFYYASLHRFVRAGIRWLLNRCDLVVVQADVLKAQFKDIIPEDRMAVLPNTIDPEFFDAFDFREQSLNECVTILFVGLLSFAKGYCDLLRVFPALAKRHNIRLKVVGALNRVERNVFFDQATGRRLRSEDPVVCFETYIRANGLLERVELFGGSVQGSEKIDVFRHSDIFVLPSYSEGFSTAILEAMAAALPVVVTGVGAAPSVIVDGVNGYIVGPGDTVALEKRIEELVLDAGLRKRMGNRNREDCEREYLIERGGRRLVELLVATGR